jgi:hypothetical protein
MRRDRLVARYWAKQKADDLSAFPEKNKDGLLALGHAYNIVTPNTSLLVLETLEQYLEHGVTPPQRSRPALYQAYLRRKEQMRVAKNKASANRLQARGLPVERARPVGEHPVPLRQRLPLPSAPAAGRAAPGGLD